MRNSSPLVDNKKEKEKKKRKKIEYDFLKLPTLNLPDWNGQIF